MCFTLILLLISNLKNVYGDRSFFTKDCKHGLDLVGFDELDGKYKQVNSIYYKDDNTSKAFEVHLNDTCHWELESNILPFPKYECRTQCLDILSCTSECINLIDCNVWEKKGGNHTSFITPIVKRSRCTNTSNILFLISEFIFIIFLYCVSVYTDKKHKSEMERRNDEFVPEHAITIERISEVTERARAINTERIPELHTVNLANMGRIRSQ